MSDISTLMEVGYSFENNLNDSSGHGRTAGAGYLPTQFASGSLGPCISSNGPGDPRSVLLNTTVGTFTDFSICFWAKQTAAWNAIHTSFMGTDSDSITFSVLFGTQLTVFLPASGGNADFLVGQPTKFPVGVDQHYTFTYSAAGVAKLYINAVLQGTVNVPSPAGVAFGPFRIAGTHATANELTGNLDEFYLYSRVLSQADISARFHSTITLDEQAQPISQRRNGGKTLAFTGSYNTAYATPVSADIQLYDAGTTNVARAWSPLDTFSASAGIWSATKYIAQGGMFDAKVRTKDGAGTVIETSPQTTNSWGVGGIFLDFGESNQAGMFSNTSGQPAAHAATRKYESGAWATNTGNGARSRANAIRSATSLPIALINCGVGGSVIADWTNPAGTNMAAALAAIAAVGGDIEQAYLWIGINDAVALTSKATLKAGFTTIAGILTSAINRDSSNFGIGITPLNTIVHATPTDQSAQEILNAGMEWIAENAIAFCAGYARDFVTTDGFHLGAPDLGHMGLRSAQGSAYRLGFGSYGAAGPRIKSARVSGSTIIITIAQDGGTGLKELDGTTDGGSVTGFEVSNDLFATTLTISSTAFSGNTVVLTLSGAPTGTVHLRYQYGKTPTITNPVFDNTTPQSDTLGLPLEPQTTFSVSKAGDYTNTKISTGIGIGIGI